MNKIESHNAAYSAAHKRFKELLKDKTTEELIALQEIDRDLAQTEMPTHENIRGGGYYNIN